MLDANLFDGRQQRAPLERLGEIGGGAKCARLLAPPGASCAVMTITGNGLPRLRNSARSSNPDIAGSFRSLMLRVAARPCAAVTFAPPLRRWYARRAFVRTGCDD
jgi:hypothetical protein